MQEKNKNRDEAEYQKWKIDHRQTHFKWGHKFILLEHESIKKELLVPGGEKTLKYHE